MPSRDAKSHGTDVPWNGDEEDWPRARDMYHAILRDEFGSDIADTMWYDKVPTDSFDFDVETACLSILNCEKRRNFKLAQSWERDDEFWTEGWVRWWFDEAKQKMFDLLRPYTSDRANLCIHKRFSLLPTDREKSTFPCGILHSVGNGAD